MTRMVELSIECELHENSVKVRPSFKMLDSFEAMPGELERIGRKLVLADFHKLRAGPLTYNLDSV